MENQFFLLRDFPEPSFHIDSDQEGGYDISHLRNLRFSFYYGIIDIIGLNSVSRLYRLLIRVKQPVPGLKIENKMRILLIIKNRLNFRQ